jgi:diaminopimelate decarboxylase
MKKGDHLVVHKVGAYNMTQWMQFITLRPNVVLLDQESHVHLIRKAETLEYIETVEQLPQHLKKNTLT